MGLSDPIKGAVAPWLAEKQSRKLQEGTARKTDAMRQQDYDVARQSMLGEFSSEPYSNCQACMANAKAARRKERLDLTKRALATCPEHEAEANKITAIRVEGEVLTKTQESGLTGMLANQAVGTKRDLAPSHDEAYLEGLKKAGKADAQDDYATYLHGMDEVIDSTEKQKREDEAALKDCIARGAP